MPAKRTARVVPLRGDSQSFADPEMWRDGAMSPVQACEFLGLKSKTTLYRWMADGRLPYSDAFGDRRIPKARIMQILAEGMPRK